MALLALRNGRQIIWEPTTELLCSACREAIDIYTLHRSTKEAANFMFEQRHPLGGDGRKYGEYWYLHKRCAGVERYLIREGADIFWGWHHMSWVLGLDKTWNEYFGQLAQYLYRIMPEGAYERLYEAWLPALGRKGDRRPYKRQRITVPKQGEEKAAKTYVKVPGYVYIIEAVGAGRYKIGRSFSAIVRLEALQTASAFDLKLLRHIKTDDATGLERKLHARYDPYKVRREWFALPPNVLVALLQEEFA